MYEIIHRRLSETIDIVEASRLYEILSKRIKEKDKKITIGEKGIIRFKELVRISHPILSKLVDKGNLTRALNKDKRLKRKLIQLIDAIKNGRIEEFSSLIEELRRLIREIIIKFIVNTTIEGSQDLRPINVPGSIGRSEIPNLYYGNERYLRDEKISLFVDVIDSIPLTRSFSIKFYGEIHNHVKHIIAERISEIPDIGNAIGLNNWEATSYPYIVLLKFIMWLSSVYEEESRDVKENFIRQLQDASGIIYVVPGGQREEYRIEVFPQLTLFVNKWIISNDKRKSLEQMVNTFSRIANESYRKSRNRKASVNERIKLMYNYLEIVARTLITYGSIEWESFRKTLDVALELILEYDIRVNFAYMKGLLTI